MKKLIIIQIIIIILALSSCQNNQQPIETSQPIVDETESPVDKSIYFDTDFESGEDDYLSGFADYPQGEEDFYELNSEVVDIPDLNSKGYLLSGNNHSDDLLMYIAKPLVVQPDTDYKVTVTFDIATNIPGGMMGVGGSPGSSVYVKAGVSNKEFTPTLDSSNYLRSNWDIGNQASDGTEGLTLGNVEKIDSEDDTYQYKNFSHEFTVKSSQDGTIYVLLAIDSGFESVSSIYFDNISIDVVEQ